MTLSLRTAVYGLIFNKQGEFLILKRSEHDSMSGIWEMPGGKLEAGEAPREGLGREIREEAGLQVEIGEEISVAHEVRGATKVQRLSFLCQAKTKSVVLSREHQDFQWTTIAGLRGQKLSVSNFLDQTLADMRKAF